MRRISFHSLVPLAEKSTSELRERAGEPIGEVAVARPKLGICSGSANAETFWKFTRKSTKKRTTQIGCPQGKNDPVVV